MSHSRIVVLAVALFIAAWAHASQNLPGQVVQAGTITPILDAGKPVYHVQKATVRPAIDGKGDEWKNVPAMVLDQQEQARNWNGPKDLSGSLRLLWDEKGLYFHLEVVDDVHKAPNYDTNWWENDCCQFAFDPYLNGPKAGYDPDEESYLVGDSPKGPIFAAYRMPGKGYEQERLLKDRTVKMSTRADGARVFEWMMTWEQLAPVSPWLLGRCGFTYCLNDNDGNGFKGAIAWTKGLIYGQDASQFGQLVFDGAQGLRATAIGLRPEVKVADTTDSYWLNIKSADPWNTARLLVSLPQGGKVTAKVEVYRPDETRPVATGSLTDDLPDNNPAVFSWNLNDLPDGMYEVSYSLSKFDVEPARVGFYQVHLDQLRARKNALRQEYGIDRPWDPMTNAPALVRRHRGLVAMTLQLLDDEAWSKAMGNTDSREQYLRTLAYGASMISTLDNDKDFLARQRGIFWSAYYSPADGSGQSFVVSLPADYNPLKAYPLIVHLHGAGGVPNLGTTGQPSKMDYILVMPWGRGGYSEYRGLGEDDVLQVIDYMKAWYTVDPNRVYVTGASMGGQGTWRMATRHPDLFAAAAPICGAAEGLPLENLRNVPVFDQHGAQDWTVPVDLSRYAVHKLQELGYPVLYKEIPDASHSISGLYPANDWMLELRRPSPKAITFTTWRQDTGAYWLKVRRLVDPHQKANVSAQATGFGAQQMLSLHLDNIAVLELDAKDMPFKRSNDLLLQINDDFLTFDGPLPDAIYLVRSPKGWAIFQDWQPPIASMRAYQPGSAANLFTGEPLMVIYGTQGTEERQQALRKIADNLSHFCGSASSEREDMPAGRFPIKSDREVTADDMTRFNLLIVGGANDNVLSAMIQSRLPFTINANNELVAGGRSPLKLDYGWYGLSYYNPLAPQRLIFLLGFDGKSELKTLDHPRAFLQGIWTDALGKDALGDVPDLYVRTPAGERKLQFTDGWQWLVLPGSERKAPAEYYDYTKQLPYALRLMQQAANADYAFSSVAKVKPPAGIFDAFDVTMADVGTERSAGGTVIAGMTGEELLAMVQNPPKDQEWRFYPALIPEAIEKAQLYHVVVPLGDIWDLAKTRQQNLHNPILGPEITKQELWEAILDAE